MEKSMKISIYIILGIFALISSFFALKYIYIYLSPFIIATILASLIDPIIEKINKYFSIPRGITVLLVLMVLIILIIVFIIVGVSQIYVELSNLLDNLPDYKTMGANFQWLLEQNNQLQELIDNLEISQSIREVINNNLQLLYDGLREGLKQLINSVLNILGKLPMILLILFLSFIATFFISKDKNLINDFIVKLFPKNWRPKVYRIRDELLHSAIGLIRALLILITITGVITGIGLIILGNQYAFILAITAAILDLIPIIGPALIFYPWILYNLISGNISFAISLFILHTILAGVRSGAEGKVIGVNIGLHPLSTMIALYVGYRVLGGIGFIVGPTILIIIKALFEAELITLEE
jgi:sporulation integral membrane protein YtvI